MFGRLGFSHVSGEFVEDGIATELYDVPGDTTTLLVGTRWLSGSVEFGYRLDDVRSRSAIVGGAPGSPAIGTQPGHRLHGAFFRFSPTDRLELRLVGDNLTNTSYRLNDGFGGAPGSAAPGRNVGITILNTF
jgi:outer membrane receptor protein involved in Fe transport